MKTARILLLSGALLLLATAAFHGSGSAMVAGWLEGDRGEILQMLWFVPSIDWAVVAAFWAVVGWRAERRLAIFVYITAIIPLAVALMLMTAVGPGFFGIWMLLGAVALAGTGAARLR